MKPAWKKHLISINQEMMVKEGLITEEESKAACDRMVFTLDKECFRDCCLVVESTVERMDIKQNFFAEISEIAPKEALLATNTSCCRCVRSSPVKRPAPKMCRRCANWWKAWASSLWW